MYGGAPWARWALDVGPGFPDSVLKVAGGLEWGGDGGGRCAGARVTARPCPGPRRRGAQEALLLVTSGGQWGGLAMRWALVVRRPWDPAARPPGPAPRCPAQSSPARRLRGCACRAVR